MGKLTFDEKGDPTDRLMLVYFTVVLCGTAMLLPYNAFIAVPPYMRDFYRYAANDPNATTTMPDVWKNIENYLMVASLVPNFIGQLGMLTSWGRSLRIIPRVMVGLICMVIAVLMIIIVPIIEVGEGFALFSLIFATVLCNGAAAVFQASMFSFAAFFPFEITQGLMLGVGLSGSTASGLAAVIKASMADGFQDNVDKARIYFSLAAVVLALAFLSIMLMKKNPYAQFFCAEMRPADYDEATALNNAEGGKPLDIPPSPESPDSPGMLTTSSSVMMLTDVPYVLKLISVNIFAVFWVYFVTLFVFPSFGVKLHSGGWFAVLIILTFNLGDFTGRFLCRFNALHLPRKAVLAGSFGRTILVVFFFLQVPAGVIDSVPFSYILMASIGVTNGFFSTQCMMITPSTVGLNNDGDRGVAGNAMSVALLGGAAAGSLVALGIVPQFSQH